MFTSRCLTLNDGRDMPRLGFGTYKIDDADAAETVGIALEEGYALVDTASIYGNERGVGEALAGRDDVFLTTKVWNSDQGFEQAKVATAASLGRLGRASVDLLLIHWPCPDRGRTVDTWKALIDLRDAGHAKSIGVSNFRPQDLEKIVTATDVVPAVNQVECHPAFQQRELRQVHDDMEIVTQSWSPLGRGDLLDHDVIGEIAAALGAPRSAVILAWHLQSGLSAIPKASSREHIAANMRAEQLSLSDEQMERIGALDDPDGRLGPDPANFC
ncbi:aldo/keto reductase [Sphingomicrobium marinum]|uniref:aldo/keto reductase n=1 Tax=Sphingomicrobium marinum TaxID=1227950 RepID=UPI00223F330D|nr:aldo/keto reductase [Sphingomicrobium marinum]